MTWLRNVRQRAERAKRIKGLSYTMNKENDAGRSVNWFGTTENWWKKGVKWFDTKMDRWKNGVNECYLTMRIELIV